MSTGPIDSWNVDPTQVGPIYPFAGSEVLMFVACGVFCLFFIVWKFFTENATYASKVQCIRTTGQLRSSLHEANLSNLEEE